MDELVTAFIRIVKNFQEVSDAVRIQLLPRNTRWIQNPPEALARLNQALARIERETGIAIDNYQDLDVITPELFDDTTHLARYTGAVVFTHFLVEQNSAYLAGTGPGSATGPTPPR